MPGTPCCLRPVGILTRGLSHATESPADQCACHRDRDRGPQQVAGLNPSPRTLISAGMERSAQGPTPACRVEQDRAGSQVLWLQQGWTGAHRHPGEVASVPSTLSVPGWPAQGPDAVTAERSSQSRRNVLLHGREEITAKECAVPRPGLGGEREEPEGKKNKLRLSQAYRAPVLLVTIFFLFPLK